MGVMRFAVHASELTTAWDGWRLAYISGLDGRVYPTRSEFNGELLSCRRSQNDSGKLSIPWPVSGYGTPTVSTTSLPEREQPYRLTLELARGKLAEVREQAAVWEMSRMAIPQVYRDLQERAFRAFARASAQQGDPQAAARQAQESLNLAFQAAEILLGAYTLQRLASVRRTNRHATGLLGCTLDSALDDPRHQALFTESFDTACIALDWRAIEPQEGTYNWGPADQLVRFCNEHRKVIRGGPLIDLGDHGLPDWLEPWKNDVLNLPSFVCDYVDTVIARFSGHIRIWEISAAGNSGGALGLSEEHRLSLVARSLETAVKKDADSQFFIRIEQPWGEYQREGRHRLSPFQFVDAIIRSCLGLTGISLDLDAGYAPRGCYARDLLSISRLIDNWSLLGVQIHVNLACPSSHYPDPRADNSYQVVPGWKDPWSLETQADWYEQVVPLLLAKPAVTGVFLRQYSDQVPHRLPHAGIIDATGQVKSCLNAFRRQRHDRQLD